MATPEIHWEVIDSTELPCELGMTFACATERIGVQAMHASFDSATEPLFDCLTEKFAQDRDLAVSSIVTVDDYSLVHAEDDEQRAGMERLRVAIEDFQAYGVDARFGHAYGTGLLGLVHAKRIKELRRNHRKTYVGDNNSYSFGGCNLTGSSYRNLDFLLHSTDERVADFLMTQISQDAGCASGQQDRVHKLDHQLHPRNIVLQDGGRHGQSIIMEWAHELLEDAEKGTIRFMSQYRPARRMEKILNSRDPEIVAFNRSEDLDGTIMIVQQALEQLNPALPNIAYPEKGDYAHAKFITAVLKPRIAREWFPEGGPVVLTGSHNFHSGGVMMGTKETSLASSDEKLVADVNNWVEKVVIGN